MYLHILICCILCFVHTLYVCMLFMYLLLLSCYTLCTCIHAYYIIYTYTLPLYIYTLSSYICLHRSRSLGTAPSSWTRTRRSGSATTCTTVRGCCVVCSVCMNTEHICSAYVYIDGLYM